MSKQTSSSRPLLSREQVAAEAVFVATLRVANSLVAQNEGLLRERGLTAAQYNTLRILRDAGPDGLSCQQISEALINRDPDVTRLADRLAERGLVVKERSAQDRRVVRVRITDAGLDLVENLDWPLSLQNERQLEVLSFSEKQQLLGLLQKLLPAPKSPCDARSREEHTGKK